MPTLMGLRHASCGGAGVSLGYWLVGVPIPMTGLIGLHVLWLALFVLTEMKAAR